MPSENLPSITPVFITQGCNRSTRAIETGMDGAVAFASKNTVALYSPKDINTHGIQRTLNGTHTDRITSVRYIKRGNDVNQKDVGIISVSQDKTGNIWRRNHNNTDWILKGTLIGHTQGINCVGVSRGKYIPSATDLICTGSSDGTIRVWEIEASISDSQQDSINCIQVIDVKTTFSLCLEMGFLPNSSVPIILAGGTDDKITLYYKHQNEFIKSISLQGHSAWIQSLALTTFSSANQQAFHGLKQDDLLVVSASQDKYCRIWKISDHNEMKDAKDDVFNAFSDYDMGSKDDVQLSTKAHIVSIPITEQESKKYTVMFDALLMGHDDWVHSVDWHPPIIENNAYTQPLSILTASADKSLMIWAPDEETGVWFNKVRVGDVGGTTLGFHGGVFGGNGNWILGQGYNGAFHVWDKDSESDAWKNAIGIAGHYGSVKDVCWDPTGLYVMSTSLDETTRLYAPWKRSVGGEMVTTWHEIARPQIHGYPLQCLDFIHKYGFVSGADEKILRVFECPKTFVQTLENITSIKASEGDEESRPDGASLPALGLSNKAINPGDNAKADLSHDLNYHSSYVNAVSTPTSLSSSLTQPPLEGHLVQHTLWPEVNKLYGHGYELMSVAASHDGLLLASASRATKAEHAVIRIWSTKTWKEVSEPLTGHALTVTSIKFSHDDKHILSVGRDRSWMLYKKDDQDKYTISQKSVKAHSRIIWDCAFTHDDKLFATASRDKSIKFWWSVNGKCALTLKFTCGVNSIDFSPVSYQSEWYLLAVGLENGRIFIYRIKCNDRDNVSGDLFITVAESECHNGSVNSIKWKPSKDYEEYYQNGNPEIVSCSDDFGVRIFRME